LAVKKLAFCPKTGVLTVAGTAGNVVLATLDKPSDDQEQPLKVTTMNLVSDRDGFVWKGHDQLKVKPNLTTGPDGVQVRSCYGCCGYRFFNVSDFVDFERFANLTSGSCYLCGVAIQMEFDCSRYGPWPRFVRLSKQSAGLAQMYFESQR
jgi:hypothetical protein